MKQITDRAWRVPMGNVNAVLLQGQDGELALVDAGFPGHEAAVFDAIVELGRRPEDLAHIVFTHAHPDHIGSAAAIVKRTGARTWMHPVDIPISETGGPFRPMTPSPRIPQRLLYHVFWRPNEPIEPVAIDEPIEDGQTIPVAGGLDVIHTPGHSAGHVSLIWPQRGLLIVGDVGSNMVGVGDPLGFEDIDTGRASQRLLAGLEFQAAAFGHGRAISANAMGPVKRGWA